MLVFVTASAAAVGAWIAMAHSATTDPNRSLAISVAHNVLTRVHASAAYYARSAYPDAIGNPADAPNADSLDYALVSKPPAFNTTASIVTAGGNGNSTPKAQQITMSVTTSLAFTNVGLVDSVAVRYPVSAMHRQCSTLPARRLPPLMSIKLKQRQRFPRQTARDRHAQR